MGYELIGANAKEWRSYAAQKAAAGDERGEAAHRRTGSESGLAGEHCRRADGMDRQGRWGGVWRSGMRDLGRHALADSGGVGGVGGDAGWAGEKHKVRRRSGRGASEAALRMTRMGKGPNCSGAHPTVGIFSDAASAPGVTGRCGGKSTHSGSPQAPRIRLSRNSRRCSRAGIRMSLSNRSTSPAQAAPQSPQAWANLYFGVIVAKPLAGFPIKLCR